MNIKCRQKRQEIYYDDHESVSLLKKLEMHSNDSTTDTYTTKEQKRDSIQDVDDM